jgi:hypothetical protein
MGFWNACLHREMPDVDEDGRAICTACGQPVQATLTPSLLAETFEMVRRDHGSYGHHSMRCVDTPDGWVCADDCRML